MGAHPANGNGRMRGPSLGMRAQRPALEGPRRPIDGTRCALDGPAGAREDGEGTRDEENQERYASRNCRHQQRPRFGSSHRQKVSAVPRGNLAFPSRSYSGRTASSGLGGGGSAARFVFDPADPVKSGFMKSIGQDADGELYATTGNSRPPGSRGGSGGSSTRRNRPPAAPPPPGVGERRQGG
jgi:hypothetical protein